MESKYPLGLTSHCSSPPVSRDLPDLQSCTWLVSAPFPHPHWCNLPRREQSQEPLPLVQATVVLIKPILCARGAVLGQGQGQSAARSPGSDGPHRHGVGPLRGLSEARQECANKISAPQGASSRR